MTIEANGFIGFNTTAPLGMVHFTSGNSTGIFLTQWDHTGTTDAVARFQNTSATNSNRGLFGVTNWAGTGFQTGGVHGLSLNAAGTGVGVDGYANSTAATGVEGGFIGGTSPTATGWGVFSNGWGGGLTAWQNVSDRRLKTNIKTLDGALSKIMQLRGVEYNFDLTNYPGVPLDTETKQIGFIAQEVEAIFPNIVREANIHSSPNESDTGLSQEREEYKVKTLSYTLIIPVLVEAMKEQQTIIEKLEKRIEELEKK
jgi:hypothetical protein